MQAACEAVNPNCCRQWVSSLEVRDGVFELGCPLVLVFYFYCLRRVLFVIFIILFCHALSGLMWASRVRRHVALAEFYRSICRQSSACRLTVWSLSSVQCIFRVFKMFKKGYSSCCDLNFNSIWVERILNTLLIDSFF